MKLTKKMITTLLTLAFTITTNAEGYKLKSCERAETSFWDTIQNKNTSSDQAFIENFKAEEQRGYYKRALGKIELSINEVRKRCKGVASKDILEAYEKKKNDIQNKLNALENI